MSKVVRRLLFCVVCRAGIRGGGCCCLLLCGAVRWFWICWLVFIWIGSILICRVGCGEEDEFEFGGCIWFILSESAQYGFLYVGKYRCVFQFLFCSNAVRLRFYGSGIHVFLLFAFDSAVSFQLSISNICFYIFFPAIHGWNVKNSISFMKIFNRIRSYWQPLFQRIDRLLLTLAILFFFNSHSKKFLILNVMTSIISIIFLLSKELISSKIYAKCSTFSMKYIICTIFSIFETLNLFFFVDPFENVKKGFHCKLYDEINIINNLLHKQYLFWKINSATYII